MFFLKTGYCSLFYLAKKRVNHTDVRFLVHLCKPPGDRCGFQLTQGGEARQKKVAHVKCWMP